MGSNTILENTKPADQNLGRPNSTEESIYVKTSRLTLNLISNILIMLIVFVCLLYSWTSTRLNVFQLHIVLCVLGYQLLMTQGTLILSKYNSWSMYLPFRYRKNGHWILQSAGGILVTYGSIVMMLEKHRNFDTCHGILGLCALIASLLGLLNGLFAAHAYKINSFMSALNIKFIHCVTGVATLFLSAICLCLGFDKGSFKSWSGEVGAITLMIFTCIFTVLVAIDFWLLVGRRIRNVL